MKFRKILCIFFTTILLFTSCTAETNISSKIITDTISESLSSQVTSDSTENFTEEYYDIYLKYYYKLSEKRRELIYASSTESTFSQNLHTPVVQERNSFLYNGLPCTVEKNYNAEDGTVYAYFVTVTQEKSIQRYSYYFDENSVTYCAVGNFSYFTTEKQDNDLKYVEIREYVQEQEQNEAFLMIESYPLCVPIETKDIFTLSEMETFFTEGTGALPNDEIVFKASMQEMVGGIETIPDIQKSQDLYKEYQKQIEESLANYSKAYEESYNKEKKFSLASEEDVDYTKTEEGFFEGFYFSKITNNAGTTSNYITDFSGAGAERFLNYLKISDSALVVQMVTIGYADRAWAISGQKEISSYSVENTVVDSANSVFSLIPELGLVIYSDFNADYDYTFENIANNYKQYTNIVQ